MANQLRTPAPLPPAAERRRLREDAGLAGSSLAAQIGVAPATVYGWEAGREPSGLLREAYAKALDQLAAKSRSEVGDETSPSVDHS
jgi:transcriptional regulator with XRE-family HTH domain